MNHLLHTTLPRGTLLELAPTQITMGRLEDGGYAFEFTDGDLTVRTPITEDEFGKLIRSAHEALESGEIPAGNGDRAKVDVVRSMPRLPRMDVPRGRR